MYWLVEKSNKPKKLKTKQQQSRLLGMFQSWTIIVTLANGGVKPLYETNSGISAAAAAAATSLSDDNRRHYHLTYVIIIPSPSHHWLHSEFLGSCRRHASHLPKLLTSPDDAQQFHTILQNANTQQTHSNVSSSHIATPLTKIPER